MPFGIGNSVIPIGHFSASTYGLDKVLDYEKNSVWENAKTKAVKQAVDDAYREITGKNTAEKANQWSLDF